MKRVKKTTICIAAVLLVLFALLQLLCAQRVQSIERSLPHAAALDSQGGVGITMEQALSTGSNSSADKMNVVIGAMSLEQLQTVRVTGVGASEPAYAAYATPLTGICLPFRYVDGNWFLPDGTNTVSLAVIPESLSLSMFGAVQSVGKSVSIGQTEFRICGVYHDEKGFLQQISGDGVPRIYLYNPLLMARLPVSVLYMADDKLSNAPLLKQHVSTAYKTVLDGKLIDYRQQIQLAHSLWYMSLLLCGLFSVILLLTFAGIQLIRLHARRNDPVSKRLKRFFISLLTTAVSLVLLMLLLNQLRFPQIYFVQDNIFDFSSYLKTIVLFFKSLHTEGWSNHFEWVFISQLFALLFWALWSIVFFLTGVLKLQRIFKIIADLRKSQGLAT